MLKTGIVRKVNGRKNACQPIQLEKAMQPGKARKIVNWKMYKAQLAAIQIHIPGNWPISG